MKFHYGDKVKAIDGFYTGLTGTVLKYHLKRTNRLFKDTVFTCVYKVQYKTIDNIENISNYDYNYFEESELELI